MRRLSLLGLSPQGLVAGSASVLAEDMVRTYKTGGVARRWSLTSPGLLCLGLLVGTCSTYAQTPGATPPLVQTAARSQSPITSSPAITSNGTASGASLPLVSFGDGLLSINATNVPLAEILIALRSVAGTDIDLPTTASTERVTAHLGPGPARKVLADLLGWSSFDYIIQGSDDDPLAVQSITLMVRGKTGTTSLATTPGPPARVASQSQPQPEPSSPPATEVAVVENRSEQPAAATPDVPDAPANFQPKVQQPTTMPWNSGGSSAGKSPSDMIQELQQMYEQRRAMQQQQNQSTGQRSP